jgi:hypothetical protein
MGYFPLKVKSPPPWETPPGRLDPNPMGEFAGPAGEKWGNPSPFEAALVAP